MAVEIYGQTDIGLVREENQDTFRCGKLTDTVLYAVVCDGMGGANGGSIASTIAADTIAARITGQYREGMPQVSVLHLLESAVDAANVEVFDRAAADTSLYGMGTTLVAMIIDDANVFAAHVGDSRLYHLRESTLKQVTVDHSVVQEMVAKGQLTAEQARRHPRKHFITRAIGVEANVQCDFNAFTLHSGDRLLLCTDGLSNMLSDDAVGELLQTQPPEALPSLLIKTAKDAGGEDNITVVVVA